MNLVAGLFDAYPLIAGLFDAYPKASSTKMIAGLFDAYTSLEIGTYMPSSVAPITPYVAPMKKKLLLYAARAQ